MVANPHCGSAPRPHKGRRIRSNPFSLVSPDAGFSTCVLFVLQNFRGLDPLIPSLNRSSANHQIDGVCALSGCSAVMQPARP
jgi:hypothetical protein